MLPQPLAQLARRAGDRAAAEVDATGSVGRLYVRLPAPGDEHGGTRAHGYRPLAPSEAVKERLAVSSPVSEHHRLNRERAVSGQMHRSSDVDRRAASDHLDGTYVEQRLRTFPTAAAHLDLGV